VRRVSGTHTLDEAFVLAAALDDLEAVHALVLRFMADTPVAPQELRREQNVKPKGWETSELAEALPEYAVMVEQVVAVLARNGLIHAAGGIAYPGQVGSAVYSVAPLGERCLFLLHDDEVQYPE
jgi:hypothetical protein